MYIDWQSHCCSGWLTKLGCNYFLLPFFFFADEKFPTFICIGFLYQVHGVVVKALPFSGVSSVDQRPARLHCSNWAWRLYVSSPRWVMVMALMGAVMTTHLLLIPTVYMCLYVLCMCVCMSASRCEQHVTDVKANALSTFEFTKKTQTSFSYFAVFVSWVWTEREAEWKAKGKGEREVGSEGLAETEKKNRQTTNNYCVCLARFAMLRQPEQLAPLFMVRHLARFMSLGQL